MARYYCWSRCYGGDYCIVSCPIVLLLQRSSTENDYEEASSMSAGESIKSAQIQPHSNRPMPTVGAATRGILKKTTFTMPAQTDDNNFEDVTLYDNSTRAERVIPARTSTQYETH